MPLPIRRGGEFCWPEGRRGCKQKKARQKWAAAYVPGTLRSASRLSQPTISHHMAILTKAGLVEATKKGQWRWYRRNEKAIRGMVKTLRGKL